MAKLVYDKTGLNTVSKSLSDTVSSLTIAVSNSNFSVPSNFKYYNYLVNLRSTISGIKNNIDSYSDWLDKSINIIDRKFESLSDIAKEFDVLKIKAKNHSILK